MLLRFTVENFLCFRDEVAFSMIATSDDRHASHVATVKGRKRPPCLRAAAIYGANAHGKTKFVEAIGFLRKLVVGGIEGDSRVGVKPFRLDATFIGRPSRFTISFRMNDVDYEYGLVTTDEGILEEWLFATFNRREVELFSRNTREASREGKVSFGSTLRRLRSPVKRYGMTDYLDFIGNDVRDNQVLLKELADRKIKHVEQAYKWFTDKLVVVTATATYGGLHSRAKKDKQFLSQLTDYIRLADTGIDRVAVESTEATQEFWDLLPPSLTEDLTKRVSELDEDTALSVGTSDGPALILEKSEEGDITVLRIVTKHRGADGEDVSFGIDEESSGTRRLLDLIPMLSESQRGNVTFVVDELDRKLHPTLSYKFVEGFLGCPEGQLIFTTHNTQLLSLELLRRDEIWFAQKASDGHVELYSLAEFGIRPDLDVRRGYFVGRFGGIPFMPSGFDPLNCGDEGPDQQLAVG